MSEEACKICEDFYIFDTIDYHSGETPPTNQEDFLATTSTIFNNIMTINSTNLSIRNWTLFGDSLNTTATSTIEYDNNDILFNLTTMNFTSNSTDNISVFCDDLINRGHCQRSLPLDKTFFSQIFYAQILPQIILAVVAILLNSMEIYLMKKRKKYYPSEYLMVSLAVADFMFSFLVVIALAFSSVTYQSGGLTRRIVLEVVDTLIGFSIFASIVHVVAISLDRLIAVVYPLRHRVRTDAIKMKRLVIGIWCLTVIFMGSLSAHQYRNGVNEESFDSRNTSWIVSILMFVSAVLVALIYLTITRRLANQANFLNSLRSKRNKAHTGSQHKHRSRRSRIETIALLTAGVVTVAFLACTLPYACLHVVGYVSDSIETLSLCLLICNSICNPLVYFWRGYWFKSNRRKKSTITAMTNVSSKSKEDSSQHHNTLASLAQSVGVAFVPIRTNMTGMRKSKNKKYTLSEMTVMDIFDFDSISRFRRFERSYYNQGRQFNESHRVDLSSI